MNTQTPISINPYENLEFTAAGDSLNFEAVSYAWGQVDFSAAALVDCPDNKTIDLLKINTSLATALRHLRYEDKARTMWIDAVCINQIDDDEKSLQVKRMSSIYKLAIRVVAGLPSDQINNQIYQSDQSIQIRYRILSDQSTQIQAFIHLIYLIFLAQRAATLELPDHPFVPAPQ